MIIFKKLGIILFIFSIFIFFPKVSFASELPVVIINQIRGSESCCQKGSIDIIQEVSKEKFFTEMPISWAFRYDGLVDQKYTDFIKKNPEKAGLLLEVTPLLASKSGVVYRGNIDGSDWYQGKNSMLIGYTQEERKKLIDISMNEFFSIFNRYPSFTVSWMIDGWSLNYLEKKYSVQFHELTKEQFETDSYTLDGGLFNAGYYPSTEFPLIPGSAGNKLNIVMVRQTVSDLLKNYGSQQSYYTSQPNDYLSDPQKKGIEYFNSLLNQLEVQNANQKIAVIGFENSYDWLKYGNEYLNQIKEIKKQTDSKKVTVFSPSEYADSFTKTSSLNNAFYYSYQFSNSFNQGVLWYFGKTYRVRMLLRENDLILDDIRVYSQISDPYVMTPSQVDYAYWIIPYVWNGSQMYTLSDQKLQDLKNKKIEGNTLSDLNTDPFGIVIPRSEFKIEEQADNLSVYFSKDQIIKFNPENFTISNTVSAKFPTPVNAYLSDLFYHNYDNSFYFKNHPSFNIQTSSKSVNIGWKIEKIFVPLLNLIRNDNEVTFTPQISTQNLEVLNPIFSPDKTNLGIDTVKSIFYWNNKLAVAGRNPIRLFILPLNLYGRTTPVGTISVEISPKIENVKVIYPSDYSFRVTPWFIDIGSEKPFNAKVSVFIDGIKIVSDVPIEIVEDCGKKAVFCITHPGSGLSYMLARFDEFKRSLAK